MYIFLLLIYLVLVFTFFEQIVVSLALGRFTFNFNIRGVVFPSELQDFKICHFL